MQKLTLALDWTPNINHIGFIAALEHGFYRQNNIDLEIHHPGQDDYETTPAKRVELGLADFALCPLESVISYRTKATAFNLQAAAAVFQNDVSAIAVLEQSSILRPSQLEGKVYASYQARYEDGIVRQMVINDGGQGNLEISYPNKLGIWETLMQSKADATWIFENWEGIEAETKGVALRTFKMADYGIPYSYSPVVACSQAAADENLALYQQFLLASKKGFEFCQTHPQEAVKNLQAWLPPADTHFDLNKALAQSLPAMGLSQGWGKIEARNVEDFLTWLRQHALESSNISAQDLWHARLQEVLQN